MILDSEFKNEEHEKPRPGFNDRTFSNLYLERFSRITYCLYICPRSEDIVSRYDSRFSLIVALKLVLRNRSTDKRCWLTTMNIRTSLLKQLYPRHANGLEDGPGDGYLPQFGVRAQRNSKDEWLWILEEEG